MGKYETSILLETIGVTSENRIIDFLIEGRGIDYSKTDIAYGSGISRPTAYKVLPKLIKSGLVKIARKVGRIALYTLNPENEKAKALMKLESLLLQGATEATPHKTTSRVPMPAPA